MKRLRKQIGIPFTPGIGDPWTKPGWPPNPEDAFKVGWLEGENQVLKDLVEHLKSENSKLKDLLRKMLKKKNGFMKAIEKFLGGK